MPDIRYVCLSDTHFGEEDSLLTNLKTASTDTDPYNPSPVLENLVECLRCLISNNKNSQKPTLILNGDILELALCTTNEAAMVFERFIELIMPAKDMLFEKIIYIPGNHDHHLWESSRETQYTEYIKNIEQGNYLPIPYHVTKMFWEEDPKPVHSYFLTRLIQRYEHLKDFVINVSYPNLGILRKESQKCVIFSHGHFIEPLYHVMSTVKNLIFPHRKLPINIWDIEAENFAWIDFFWSTMGRSGEVGKDVELFYEKMHNPEQLKKLLYNIADGLAQKYDLPGWGDKIEAGFLKIVINLLIDRGMTLERNKKNQPLSEEAEKGLWDYMNGPLKEQILSEQVQMPTDVTFVFGHTHKPFQEDLNFKYFPEWVNVYNSGGWIVENVKPEPIHGGAIILVDENLNTISLDMYNEEEKPDNYQVKVSEATHEGEKHNPLFNKINQLVNPREKPWKEFSDIVARSVRIRAQNLRARINENR